MTKLEIKTPEVGMDAVFYPAISDKPEKKGEMPASARGRVIFVNYRTKVFTVERKATLGLLRESFKFFDIGQQIKLYRNN